MTKNIFLIGNGFDMAHGLKTSYSDFIEYIINQSINCDKFVRENIVDVGNLFSEKQTYDYIKENFAQIASASDKPVAGKIYFKNSFFRALLSQYFTANWIDIEHYYFKFLGNVSNSAVDKLNDEFEIIKQYLCNYLKEHCSKDEAILIPEFLDIFENGKSKDILFLNFNYTRTPELYIEKMTLAKKTEIIYIHGELDSKENPIIFGYGDDSSGNYQTLLQKGINKYLLNLKRQQYNLAESYKRLRNYINSSISVNVYCIGHSLGLSDKTLLKEIFENPKVKTIKAFYYKDITGFRELNDNISRIVDAETLNEKVVNFPSSALIPQFKKK